MQQRGETPGPGASDTADASRRAPVADAVRSLVAFHPTPGGPWSRLWIALRAAASMGIPLAVLTALGYPAAGLQMSAGAFLALFFASHPARERAKALPVIAAVLLACAALGALLAPVLWLQAAGLVVVAVLASAFAYGFRVGPPGPVFFVLVYGLAGMITAPRDGVRPTEPMALIAALAAGLAFSYLIAVLPLLARSRRQQAARSLRQLLPGPWFGAGEKWLAVRVALVALLGTLVSVWWVDPERAYWTVAAGIAVIGLSTVPHHSFARGLHRTLGTFVGVGAYLVIAPLAQTPWVFVLLLPLLQFVIELVVVRNYGLALIFITPLVLLIAGAATGSFDHLTTALERLVDTAVGSALAMLSGVLRERPKRG